ncbi:MAG: hypothetical protein LAO04_00395 [Acidobacteriia bacterium]|nr:hypothetical protein [Terriglobia bacterium]
MAGGQPDKLIEAVETRPTHGAARMAADCAQLTEGAALLGAQRLTAMLDVERTRALRTVEQFLGLWPRSDVLLHYLAD